MIFFIQKIDGYEIYFSIKDDKFHITLKDVYN